MVRTPIDVSGIYSYRDNLQISHAVKAGNTIYISGQVALDPDGNVVGEGRVHLMTSWWYATFPGLAITFTVLGLNLVGDWIRDVFDPKSRLRNL